MSHHVLAQAGSSFSGSGYSGSSFAEVVITYLAIVVAVFFISLYIFRAIFNIPSFLKYQRAQIRLLEEIAKHQGVDKNTIRNIVVESHDWDTPASTNNTNS